MPTNNQDQSLVHREMARRAQDVHRVRNPRSEDYKLTWDGYIHLVPANGTADIQTYLVDKYLREMTDLILREKQDNAVKEENKLRLSRGEKTMDKWETQHVFESGVATSGGMNDPEARMEIYKELYVGLVKEYGVERVEKEKAEAIPTTHEQLMGQLLGSRQRVVDSEPPILQKGTSDSPQTPLQQMTQFELRKVAKEKGIETTKKDKKDELISRISQQV